MHMYNVARKMVYGRSCYTNLSNSFKQPHYKIPIFTTTNTDKVTHRGQNGLLLFQLCFVNIYTFLKLEFKHSSIMIIFNINFPHSSCIEIFDFDIAEGKRGNFLRAFTLYSGCQFV